MIVYVRSSNWLSFRLSYQKSKKTDVSIVNVNVYVSVHLTFDTRLEIYECQIFDNFCV